MVCASLKVNGPEERLILTLTSVEQCALYRLLLSEDLISIEQLCGYDIEKAGDQE